MGIPTVNGALVVDPGYLANPLVFCGTVGVIPRGMADKHVEPGDRIVAIGGRTGRDGIHGATFSSAELTGESEIVSGGAVQIGNAITEKMVLDVIAPGPRPRPLPLDHRLRRRAASARPSARWAAELGAEVELDRAPLKYEGLSYTEIWISEAQERMVLAVPPEKWPELQALCDARGGRGDRPRRVRRHRPADAPLPGRDRRPTCRWTSSTKAGPPVVRDGDVHAAARAEPLDLPDRDDYTADLLALLRPLGRLQQGMDRPPVRPRGPGRGRSSSRWSATATTARATPRSSCRSAGSTRGLAIACGINPRYGRLDPYAMAGCVIDEAIRNCVAVGRRPRPDRPARQLLLGQHRAARDARLARPGRAGVPRPGPGLRHAVHLGQGQPQ